MPPTLQLEIITLDLAELRSRQKNEEAKLGRRHRTSYTASGHSAHPPGAVAT